MNNLIKKISHIRLHCPQKEHIIVPNFDSTISFKGDKLTLDDDVKIDLPANLKKIEIWESEVGRIISFHRSKSPLKKIEVE